MQAGNPKKLTLALGALVVAGAVLAYGLLDGGLMGAEQEAATTNTGDRPASGAFRADSGGSSGGGRADVAVVTDITDDAAGSESDPWSADTADNGGANGGTGSRTDGGEHAGATSAGAASHAAAQAKNPNASHPHANAGAANANAANDPAPRGTQAAQAGVAGGGAEGLGPDAPSHTARRDAPAGARWQDLPRPDGQARGSDGLPAASAKTRPASWQADGDQAQGHGGLSQLQRVVAGRRQAMDASLGAAPAQALADATPSDGAGDTVDWALMFKELLEREHATVEPLDLIDVALDENTGAEELLAVASVPTVDPDLVLGSMALRGVLAGPGGGLALVDGHLLRLGDVVPGTEFELVGIHRDRVDLVHPGLERVVRMPLAPLQSTSSGFGGNDSSRVDDDDDEPAPESDDD